MATVACPSKQSISLGGTSALTIIMQFDHDENVLNTYQVQLSCPLLMNLLASGGTDVVDVLSPGNRASL